MFRSSSGRPSPSSSSRPKESRTSRSGTSASGSRSPSPLGRRSPPSSHPFRRSPSPRRMSRAYSPSGASWSRRGSEQPDGSLSQRLSLGRHPQFASKCSPRQHSESSEEQSLQTAVGDSRYTIDLLERRRQSDRVGSPVDSLSDVDRGDFADCPVFSRRLSCPQSHEQYSSPEGSPSSSFNRRYNKDCHSRDVFLYQSDFNKNYDHLQDISREPDRDGKLLRKHLYSLEERGREPECLQYDREDRLLDVSMDPQALLAGKQNYHKRIPPRYPDEDYRELENSRSEKKSCQSTPISGYVIPGLTNSVQSLEPQFLHTPEKAPAMPKKSILKKRIDDPSVQVQNFLKCAHKNSVAESMNKESQACVDNWRAFFGVQPDASEQNFGNFLRKKEDQESTSEFADLGDDFLLPHERASQDESGFSHIQGRMADFASTQEQRRHSFLDVEDEEKFLYGDEEGDSNINYPSTEKLTMNRGKESVSLNKRPTSPMQSVKPDTSEGPGIEYEKIHDLLKTIGLDIGMAEIDKGAARTQERLHGKKTLCSLDGPPYKANSSEKDSIQSNTQSSGPDQQNSLSPCGSSQPSNDVSSASISEHAKSTIILPGYNNSGTLEQSFPSISVIPSASPLLPNLPLPPPPFSAFLAAQVLQNCPPPAMAPPSYNIYGHCMAYSAPAWPMYAPPQQSNPVLPDVHGLASVIMPQKPTRSNLKIIETVSAVKENPEIKKNNTVLVEVPITSEKPQVIEGDKQMSEQARQKKLAYLRTEFYRRWKQHWRMEQFNQREGRKGNDPLLGEMKRVQDNIVNQMAQLIESNTAEIKQSHLDNVSHIIGNNTLRKSRKKASKNLDSLEEEKAGNKKTQEKTSNSIKVYLNKNPLCKERRNLGHQAKMAPIQETVCSLKRKQCEKQKDRDERSAKVARTEESEIVKELREEGDETEMTKEKNGSQGQKLMIRLLLKKDNMQVEKEKGEVEESQKESSQLSSEKYSLRKTETNNQSQDQDVAAPKAESPKEDKCRENKSQPGNPVSKQKVTVTKAQNLGMRTKEQEIARAVKVQQHFKRFDSPHCHLLSPLPPGPLLSLVATSALDKPAPAKAPGIKSSDASTELLPDVKKGNPERVLSPNIAKAFSGGAVILKSSQENAKLQEQVEMQLQPKSVSDIVEHAKVQKQEVTEVRKVGAAEEWAMLKMVKKKQLQTSQKPHCPSLTPRLPSLLSLPLRPLMSSVPVLPHPPQPLFPPAVSGPANKGHSLCTHSVPCLKRKDKKMTVSAGQKKSVWIVGPSIVFQAGTYTASSGWDSNLGLGDCLHITWLGHQGLRWPSLLSIISNRVFQKGPPDAIIIQLGDVDLLAQENVLLSHVMTADLQILHDSLPQTSLFWSTLLEQREWHGADSPEKVNLARRKVSKAVSEVVEGFGGLTIPHPDISFRLASLFQSDGVHLSEWGMDIWLHDIRYALLKWLQA